jgi:hypothetical protein
VDEARIVSVDMSQGRKLGIPVTELGCSIGSVADDPERALASVPDMRFADVVASIESLIRRV